MSPSEGKPASERRVAKRVPIRLDVTVGDEATQTENISASGLFLRSTRSRRVGQLVSVKVAVPGEKPTALMCVVARVTQPQSGPSGVGLRLFQPKADEAKAWGRLVDRIEQMWDQRGDAGGDTMRASIDWGRLPS